MGSQCTNKMPPLNAALRLVKASDNDAPIKCPNKKLPHHWFLILIIHQSINRQKLTALLLV
jgi:hypothetical protein